MSWRTEARAALRTYPKAKRKQNETGTQQITPAYNGQPGSHTARRTTEDVALQVKLTPYEENVISAVEFMFRMQNAYPNAEQRMKMVKLVYMQRTHKLEGAALECHYSVEALKRWSNEILAAVYTALKK